MKIMNSLILIIMVSAVLLFTGCGKDGDNYGRAIEAENAVSISSIFEKPAEFEGKTVKIEGKIVQECPTGCWFDLADGGAPIRVDINPSGFAIPQKVGSTAVVEGEVVMRDKNPVIIGTGVKIR